MQKKKEKSNQSWCGGYDERWQPLSRVEIFSISENEWKFAPDLIRPRYGHGIGRIGDLIFIIGGVVKGGGFTKTVERFSNLKKEWKEISPMNKKRRNPGVGVVDDKIFVIGGFDDRQDLKYIQRKERDGR